jgi:hypothetical protein
MEGIRSVGKNRGLKKVAIMIETVHNLQESTQERPASAHFSSKWRQKCADCAQVEAHPDSIGRVGPAIVRTACPLVDDFRYASAFNPAARFSSGIHPPRSADVHRASA